MKLRLILVSLILLLMARPISADITTGLVAKYLFDGNANDSSSNGHNGTVFGATLTADRFGTPNSAYSFNGTSDYINVAYSPDFQLPAFTVSAWVNPSVDLSATSEPSAIVARGEDLASDNNALFLGVAQSSHPATNGVVLMYEDNGDNEHYFDTGSYPTVGSWTNITATRSAGDDIAIYVDGSLAGSWSSTTDPTNNNFQDLIIGATWSVPTVPTAAIRNFFSGDIDDVAIYNRALSLSDVRELNGLAVIPAPGAIALGMIGIGCVRWMRRRKML